LHGYPQGSYTWRDIGRIGFFAKALKDSGFEGLCSHCLSWPPSSADAISAWLLCCSVHGLACGPTYIGGRKQETGTMSKQNNIFKRAIDAIVEGRTRQAARYVAQFERDRSEARKVNTR